MRGRFSQSSGFLLSALQSGINHLLNYDPDTRSELRRLEGRVIAVEVTQPTLQLFILPDPAGLQLTTTRPLRVDVTISGHASALIGMITRRDRPNTSQGHVEIRGDVHLAQRVQHVLKSVNIDWEEFISRYAGDMAAHRIGRLSRDMRGYISSAGRTLASQFSEYLIYEQDMLPVRHEVERFVEEVDTLRDDVERTQLRLKRLEQQRGRGK